ncbi:hypothetical protein HXX76_007997 [Chlamydomonas incerta]|uniref:Uncharacterized protein n=1 Tax=Chlamydomonas incerta TaxID=51695 RepID=A0A835SVV1_CHLIN|nr:hypothetical protein HXX76_007997 [Chlamydomonas incerta]|eukprot:KAG2434272.1 hypothetical protein HXX76_007997 [Chlamydomonas incerta]
MGPTADPSSISLTFFSDHIATDVLQVLLFVTLLGTWAVDARVELAACLVEAACALTCLSWHGAKVPGGPPHPAALLAGRALVPLVNLSLAYAAGRWRPAAARGVSHGGRARLKGKLAASPKGCAKDDACTLVPPTEEADTQCAAAPGSSTGTGGSTVEPRQLSGASGMPVQGPSGSSTASVIQSSEAVPAQPPYRAFRWHADAAGAAAAPDSPAAYGDSAGSPPAANLHGGGSSSNSMQAEGQTARADAQPPYRALVRHVTMHYKIPWAEPEDITPGFEERLSALSAARGRVLTGVYVRAGCIELTLTLADRAGRHGDAAAGAHADSDVALCVEEVFAALGLRLPAGPADSLDATGGAGTAPDLALPSTQLVAIQRAAVGTACMREGRSGAALGWANAVDASPRVLLLAPGATAASAAVLRVRVAFGGSASPATATGVAVRGTAGFLAARVTAQQLRAATKADAEAGAEEWEYAIELMEALPHPQLLTVQLAFPAAGAAPGGGGVTAAATPSSPQVLWLSVPVLAVDDAAVAAELSAALQRQQHTAAVAGEEEATAAECAQTLMCDLGLWLAAAAPADGAADGSAAVRRLPAGWVSELGAHLLAFTESAGLVATAARIRAAGAQPLAAQVSGTGAGSSSAGNGGGQKAGKCGGSAEAAGAKQQEEEATAVGLRRRGPPSLVAVEGSGKNAECEDGNPGHPSSSGSSHSRRDGLQEYAEAWIVTMCKTCQFVECLVALSFAGLGAKAGQPLWSAESAVVYAGLGMGTVTTLAGLWMTPRAWSRLALAARLPRFLGFMAAKFLLSAGALPPPAGAATYAGGAGILLLEGVILPSGCLLPPRTALLMSCVKLPLNAMSGLAVGAFAGALPAALMALAVEAAALGTTLACHGYVRRHCMHLQRQ